MAPPRKRNTPFGQLLRALREALKMDQRAFATLIPVSDRTVSRWENGRRPSPDQIERLLSLAERPAPAVHDAMATLFGYELESAEPAVAPQPAPPVAPPPPPRPTLVEQRAALDAVVYAASEERDLLPRHLRAFGVELLQAVDRLGVTVKEAAELLAVRERAKTKAAVET
jgi:transcriptional regulator with XRE-family HTH domain